MKAATKSYQRLVESSTTTYNLHNMSNSAQISQQPTTTVSDPEQEVYEEIGSGVIRSTASLLFWTHEINDDAEQNFTKMMSKVCEQMKLLEEEKSDDSGVFISLKGHEKARQRLERNHQEGIVFTRDIMGQLTRSSRVFSLEESAEEASRRDNAYKNRVIELTEKLKGIHASETLNFEEKIAASDEAAARLNYILTYKACWDYQDAKLMKRQGLSRELWGETIEELMNREIAERRG